MGNNVSTVAVGITTVENRLTISDKNCTVRVGPTGEASTAENKRQLLLIQP